MASHEIKTERIPTHIVSPFIKDFNHLAYVTEYTATSSSDTEVLNDSTTETEDIKIEDEMTDLFYDHHILITREEETYMEKKILHFRNFVKTTKSVSKALLQRTGNGRIKDGYMSQMPDEIIMMFLRYVYGMDRINLGSTCKRFRHLLLHSGVLWDYLCIKWSHNSHLYATLAPQITRLVIVLNTKKNMDDFCLNVLKQKRSITDVIQLVQRKSSKMCQPIFCWIRNKNVYKKYEIYPHSGSMNFIKDIHYFMFSRFR